MEKDSEQVGMTFKQAGVTSINVMIIAKKTQ
jgi:hypothetical protein